MPAKIDPEVRAIIKVKAEEGWDGPQIENYLEGLLKDGRIDHVPHLRTIQNIIQPVQKVDPSEPWRLTDLDPDVDAHSAMRVLADVLIRTDGKRQNLTIAEARIVSRISAAAPKLSGFEMFMLAREYIRREERGEPVDDLDLFVALATQSREGLRQRYQELTGREAPSIPAGEIIVNVVVDESGAGQASAQFVVEPSKEDQS